MLLIFFVVTCVSALWFLRINERVIPRESVIQEPNVCLTNSDLFITRIFLLSAIWNAIVVAIGEWVSRTFRAIYSSTLRALLSDIWNAIVIVIWEWVNRMFRSFYISSYTV